MSGLPSLTDLLKLLSVLGEQPAAIGILITALVIVVVHDWRWSLLALTVQYILTGWLLTGVLEPQVAMLKILVGLIIGLVLYITARQTDTRRAARNETVVTAGRVIVPISLAFRLLIGLLAGIVILNLTDNGTLALPELAPHINLAAVGLMAMGLLAVGLTDEPLKAGMGLLTTLAGFELFYHSLEQAITVIGFLIGIDFLVAIITAYLTIAHHWAPEDTERGKLT